MSLFCVQWCIPGNMVNFYRSGYICLFVWFVGIFLPARASEQGNVIGSVRIYIYICIYIYIYVCVYKKNCN